MGTAETQGILEEVYMEVLTFICNRVELDHLILPGVEVPLPHLLVVRLGVLHALFLVKLDNRLSNVFSSFLYK